MKSFHLARRGDVDEGGVLVVIILVRRCVRALGRGQRLGDPLRKADMGLFLDVCDGDQPGQGRGGRERERESRSWAASVSSFVRRPWKLPPSATVE